MENGLVGLELLGKPIIAAAAAAMRDAEVIFARPDRRLKAEIVHWPAVVVAGDDGAVGVLEGADHIGRFARRGEI